jgi:hypothetical protein
MEVQMLLKVMLCTAHSHALRSNLQGSVHKTKERKKYCYRKQCFFVHDALDTDLQHTNTGSELHIYSRTLRKLFGCWWENAVSYHLATDAVVSVFVLVVSGVHFS